MKFIKPGPPASARAFFSGGHRARTVFRQTLDHLHRRLKPGFVHGSRVRHLQPPAPAPAPRSVGWNQEAAAPAFPGTCMKLEHRAQQRINMPTGRRPLSATGQFPCPIQATQTEVAWLLPPPGGVTKPRSRPAKTEALTERKTISSRRRRGSCNRWAQSRSPTRRTLAKQPHPPSRRGLSRSAPSPQPRPRATRGPTRCSRRRGYGAANSTHCPLAAAMTLAGRQSPQKDRRKGERSEMARRRTTVLTFGTDRTHVSAPALHAGDAGCWARAQSSARQYRWPENPKDSGHRRLLC